MIRKTLLWCAAVVFLFAQTAQAHFGMVIPSADHVLDKGKETVTLTVAFAHPMEGSGMDLVSPKEFVMVEGETKTDLKAALKEIKLLDHKAWQASQALKKPGVYSFYMVPEPYWEPAEDCFIQHFTKVVIPAFGEEEGWDKPLGLKTEIVPLTRPFGNYAGNVFQGRVLLDGKPAAGCPVEVEYYNKDKKYAAPNDYMVTQVVTTDDAGVFTYVAPWSGWWGFAALNTAAEKIAHDGQDKDVELGAVLWTYFVDPVKGKK
jgi:cobalt/nickel transport protein